MSNQRYKIVFSGELARAFDQSQVQANLAKLFKIDIGRAQALFAGRSVVLKRGLDYDSARKYRLAIRKVGAIAEVQEDLTSAERAVPTPAAKASMNNVAASSVVPPAFDLAPVGADLLDAEQRAKPISSQIDTSNISANAAEGYLVTKDEHQQMAEQPLDVSPLDVSIAPVGADVLTLDEREVRRIPQVILDTSALSIAEVGATLAPDKPAPPPAPDVSGMHLAADEAYPAT